MNNVAQIELAVDEHGAVLKVRDIDGHYPTPQQIVGFIDHKKPLYENIGRIYTHYANKQCD